MRLIGSPTSPFVRRIRILLEEAKIPYECQWINVNKPDDSAFLSSLNPIHKIPILIDGSQTLWDSRIIQRYLSQKYQWPALSWNEENTVSAVDSALEAAITLFYLNQKAGLNTEISNPYFDHQKNRIVQILTYLQKDLAKLPLNTWGWSSISLFCFLQWGQFRNMLPQQNISEYGDWLDQWLSRESVSKTKIEVLPA